MRYWKSLAKKRRSRKMSIQEAAPAEKTQPSAPTKEAPPAVQEADPGCEEETKSEEVTPQSPQLQRLRKQSVQRELFQQLADDVPQDTKEPKDLTRDEYVMIHHKPRVSINPRMDTKWMERNEDFDDHFLVDDDEIRAAKKKVGQMEDKMLGIKKVKITKAQRKQTE
ncbi:hypothetical protein LEN26_019603 [Aphanomyces euteiches]|nr:hypothetical protein LEN26_019603 [Aphanomyces euteiches]